MYASLDGRIDCAMTEKIDLEAKSYYTHLASFGDFTQINGKTTNAMHYAESGVFEPKNYRACGKTFFKAEDAAFPPTRFLSESEFNIKKLCQCQI